MKNVHEVEIKLESEWVKTLDTIFKKKNKEVKIDGFRKGTAPKEIFLKNFGIESLYGDAVDACINMAYKQALDKDNLIPVVEPTVDVTDISKDSCTFKFTIITKPEITLGEYKNLKIKKSKIEVTDDEINDEIEHLRSHMADVVVKENGTIVEGDTAVISFTGIVDGKEVDGAKGENYPLEIGSHSFIPGFEEGLIGLKTGDKKELNLKFPENYVEDLKGKDVLFKVEVNEVKTRLLPELNEDFYEDLGYENVKNEEDLRAKIKEDLMHEKEHNAEDEFVDKCLEKAAGNMKVELNPEIIDDEVNRMINQYAEQLQMQGLNIAEFYKMTGTKEEDLRKQMSPEAEKRVKYRYLLEEIAEVEKFDITDDEAKERAEEIGKKYGVSGEEVIEQYGSLDVVKYDMKMHKAIECLKDNN